MFPEPARTPRTRLLAEKVRRGGAAIMLRGHLEGAMENTPRCFRCIPLGVEGGLIESNLPAYLLAPIGSTDFVCLDAGTLLAGLKVARANGCFSDIPMPPDSTDSVEGRVLRHHVRAFLISHTYLDHVAGLIMNSPADSAKPIMALEGTIEGLQRHVFNWVSWPNFGGEGEPEPLGKYESVILRPGEPRSIPNTTMCVEAHPLAHGARVDSTAFLVDANGRYVVYMGDTGPDHLEAQPTTRLLWERLVPLVRDDRLRAVFIESSYRDETPDDQLFSHLTPAWVMHAFRQLAALIDPRRPDTALAGLTVVITHIKPHLDAGEETRHVVRRQLAEKNDLGLRLIFAEQGEPFEL
jgi:3',5'-cyclic-nucleotide phosphodiesterase